MSKTIVCFGDSNTHGYRSENRDRFPESERWTGRLGQLLGPGFSVKEEGLSGRTTVFDDPLFEGLSGLNAIFQSLMTHEPVELLLIMLGTNDVKERFGVNAENIAKGLERLINKAVSVRDAWQNGPNILVIAPAPIEEGYDATFIANEMGRGCVEKSRELAGYYQKTAALTGCHFLDAGTLGLHMHPDDHMHLDKAGHETLACRLAVLIPELLR